MTEAEPCHGPWPSLENAVYSQLISIWVRPEIELRQRKGLISKPFPLEKAQVLFRPGQFDRPEIRLNDEVRVSFEVQLKGGCSLRPGDAVHVHHIESVASMDLLEGDLDAGHITLVIVGDRMHIAFDARYHRPTARRHLDLALDFIDSARDNLTAKRIGPFVESLFAGAELCAKAELLLMANSRVTDSGPKKGSRTHKAVRSEFNRVHGRSKEHRTAAEVLNRLADFRKPARYLEGELQPSQSELHEMLLVISQLQKKVARGLGRVG